AYPPPDSFPRKAWRHKVKEAYDIFRDSDKFIDYPSQEAVALYYERRAPQRLRGPAGGPPPAPLPAGGRRQGPPPPEDAGAAAAGSGGGGASPPAPPPGFPGVSHLNLVRLSDPRKLDLLVCDAQRGEVRLLKLYEREPQWRTLARLR